MPDPSLGFDADLWSFVNASYDLTPTLQVGDLRVVLTEKNGITYAAFPGTRPDHLEDWITDFAAQPHYSVDHPEIGLCHAGVIEAVEAAFQQFADAVKDVRRLMGGGHSLGGGFVMGMGALAASRKIVFEWLTTFGGMRVGMDAFRTQMTPIGGRRYRNGDDPVPELPPYPYRNDRGWTRIGEPSWNPADDHAIKAYGAALGLVTPARPVAPGPGMTQALADQVEVVVHKLLPAVFLPYQQELWLATDSNNLVVVEKSRRTGYSWALGAVAEDHAGRSRQARGEDVLYMGYDKEMAREFIDYVAEWAKSLQIAASAVEEFIFTDPDHPEKDVNAFRIKFASGYEVIALPSVARALRGKQGLVILDEAAFIDDLEEVLKAAMALLMWGGRVVVVSTHNGETNPFSALINDIRGGRRSGIVLRLTFKEAVAQGLYHRVCLRMGIDWTQAGEDAWVADIYSKYGDSAAEELDVIPNPSTGAYLTGALIEARSVMTVPVLHYTGPDGIGTWPEHMRRAEINAWIDENLRPVVDALDPNDLFAVGEDFGRIRDLTVIWLLALTSSVRRETRLVVELRNVPFEQQKQILHYILDRIRFRAAKLDAGGNGAYLAEVTMQRYGARVEEVKFTEDWYRQNWPPAKAALEDDMATLPMDRDIHSDLRSVKLIRGVARVADRARVDEKASRHGDAAIAFVLAYAASCADPEEYAYEAAAPHSQEGRRRWRERAEEFDEDEDQIRTTTGMMPNLRGTAAWQRQ